MRQPYESDVNEHPPYGWVYTLRHGHWVWLPKEQEPAQVEMRCEITNAWDLMVRLPIRRFSASDNRYRDVQIWTMDAAGRGFDGSRILLPYVDMAPTVDLPLPLHVVSNLQLQLQKMGLSADSVEEAYDALLTLIVSSKS